MKKNVQMCLLALLCLVVLQACSVGMALSGKESPALGVIRVGASRGEIEMQLGPPVEILDQDDKRIDVYEYEVGNEPSAGRAIGHGVMDILTFGLWEVIGTPIEGMQGTKKRITIYYDENDVVTRLGGTTSART